MFLHSFVPSEILLRFGGFSVYAYGFFLAVGITASYGVCLWQTSSLRNHIDRLILPLLIGGFFGARLFFVFSNIDYFKVFPAEIFAVWHGGLVLHGAFIGGGIAVWLYARLYKLSFLNVFDHIVIGIPLGQAIGRWGNYFNQEAYGYPTALPWGIPIDPSKRFFPYESFSYFHPTFLYESFLDFFIFFLLLFFITKRKKSIAGFATSLYLITYSIGRFFIEFLRIDEVPTLWDIRLPQYVSLVMLIAGAILFFYTHCFIRHERGIVKKGKS